jgi:outer membrane protein TolC
MSANGNSRAGGISDYDLRSQRTAVAEREAPIPSLELQLDSINNQLALLMGTTPSEAQTANTFLDAFELPGELPLTLPSRLVRQRPDIRAAEALLHQASANVGHASANLYPQVMLSGNVGGLGTKLNTGGDVWNVGAAITAPIFNGGALRAEKRQAQAAYDQACSVYRQAVLQSFRLLRPSMRSSMKLRPCGRER